jgi:hypothetical protein
MYYATGLPGWMRFGGWGGGWPMVEADPATERQMLEQEVDALERQLGAVRKRLESLAGSETGGEEIR